MKKLRVFENIDGSDKKTGTDIGIDSWDASRLLQAIYELNLRTDLFNYEQDETEAEQFKDCPSLRIRHERIVAVMNAYNIRFSTNLMRGDSMFPCKSYPVMSFLEGNIELKQLPKSEILQIMQPIIKAAPRQKRTIKRIIDNEYEKYQKSCINSLYRGLMDYRLALGKTINSVGGNICGSGSFLSMCIADHFSVRHIRPNLKYLDDLIIKLVKGNFRTITEAELIEKYNYPDVSDDKLSDMDVEAY